MGGESLLIELRRKLSSTKDIKERANLLQQIEKLIKK